VAVVRRRFIEVGELQNLVLQRRQSARGSKSRICDGKEVGRIRRRFITDEPLAETFIQQFT
jgi:hypothetical protein